MVGVEDAVNEAAGIIGGIFLGEIYRFIDHDFHRRVRGAQFVHRQPQNGPIDRRKAIETPVGGVLADQFVERRGVMRGALEQLICKSARLRGGFRAFPEAELEFFGHLLAHVPLKQHLHGEFP